MDLSNLLIRKTDWRNDLFENQYTFICNFIHHAFTLFLFSALAHSNE